MQPNPIKPQALETDSSKVTNDAPKPKTLQENPPLISDGELERYFGPATSKEPGVRHHDQAETARDILDKKYTLTDLIDNLTLAEADKEYVTGKENKRLLERRIDALKSLIGRRKEKNIIYEANYENYERDMSFSPEQKEIIDFIYTLNTSVPNNNSDLENYNLAKDFITKHSNEVLSNWPVASLKGLSSLAENKSLTWAQFFEKYFPRSEKK